MFSFFKSKKPSPTQIPTDTVATDAIPSREDDFIFIDRRDPSPKRERGSALTNPGDSGLYPQIHYNHRQQRGEEKVNNVMVDVPFRLTPQLCIDTRSELVRIQVNDVLSHVARVKLASKYDFSLERCVLNG